jgi:CheY-like chemotaxis protein
MQNFATILTVDDQPEALEILNHLLKQEHYQTISAQNGKEALEILNSSHNIDAILLDRMMPVMDGISLLHKLRNYEEYSDIPVIMQTAADNDFEIREGIDAGAYYYVTKPFSHQTLISVLKSALRLRSRHKKIYEKAGFYLENRKKLMGGLGLMKSLSFEFNRLNDIKNIAYAASCCFPEPAKIMGAITELLLNAHEHGNLGISFSEKSDFLKEGTWEDEILFRELMPENISKKVQVEISRNEKDVSILIADEGNGFEYKKFLTLDPARAKKLNGRGVYLAALDFDELKFLRSGSQVIARVNL